MLRIFLFLLLIIIVRHGVAQSSFIPQNLGPSVNSPFDEISPVITANLKKLFFSRINHPQNHSTVKNTASIWYAERNGIDWSAPQRMDVLNTGKFNIVLSVTADGQQLLTCSDGTLFISRNNDGEWTPPVRLDIKATKDAALSPDGNYLIFNKGLKLYVSEKKEQGWSEPFEAKGLPATSFSAPHLANDNKSLYYSSKRKSNGLDLFKVNRLGEGWDSWSAPVALSDTINTSSSETALRTNPQGSWGYFSSNRQGSAGADIFQVKLYEDRPYVLVTGKILNAVTERPLNNKDATILVNNQPAADFTINKDSAVYRVKLPFGGKYRIAAQVDHYTFVEHEIDASSDKEFKVIKQNMELGPQPYALLKGKLLIKNTSKVIPATAKPKILIDGEEVDSAFIDVTTGSYALKLNHGASYYVQVSAKRFESLPEVVDLTTVDGYEEITLDLQADAEKMAIVTGSIIDKSTGKRLEDLSTVRLVVEGVSSVIVNINESTDQYELRIPLREKHTISAYLPGYCSVYEIIDVSNETREVKLTRDLTVVPFERGQTVRLNNIFFEPGRSTINKESYPALDRLVTFLNTYPDVKIEIGGHTDNVNKISTLNMAREVANYLTNNGIDRNRIAARGYASTKPVASNNTPEGRALNRRIEFTILEK